jgi:hypothetical protein
MGRESVALTKIETALAQLVEGLKELRTGDEYVDQYSSPLGKRGHLEAVRAGKLQGFKPPGTHKVLVRKDELDRYLAQHPARAKKLAEDETEKSAVDQALDFKAPRRRKKGQAA